MLWFLQQSCESWAVKKAEYQRTDAFELWCWRRLLRVPWTARRSNQSIIKEINPDYSLEGLIAEAPIIWSPNVKSQLVGTLMLGKTEGKRRRGRWRWDGWMASPTQWTWVWVDCGRWIGRPGMMPFMGLQRVEHNWAIELKILVIAIAFQSGCKESKFRK